ncbi:MAG: DUF3137 domain-containing protein [Bacteroidota bacterium]
MKGFDEIYSGLSSLFEEADFEKQRLRRGRIRAALLWICIGVLVVFFILYSDISNFAFILVFALVLFLFSYIHVFRSYRDKYKNYFKSALFIRMVRSIGPNLSYLKNGKVPLKYYNSSGLFSKVCSDYEGEDYIYGEYEDFYLNLSELSISRSRAGCMIGTLMPAQNSDFTGLFMALEFSNDFPACLKILPSNPTVAFLEKIFHDNEEDSFQKVEIGLVSFDNEFDTLTDEPENASTLLTPEFLEKVLALKNSYGHVYFSFRINYFFMALHCVDDMFEPYLEGSSDDPEQLKNIYEQLRGPIEMAECVAVINRNEILHPGSRAE